MARFRKIDTRLHSDSRFLRLSRPQPNGQSLFQYLLTGPHTTNIPGLSVAGEAQLAEAIGWPLEAFRKAFAEVSSEALEEGHENPLAKADWNSRVVFIPNAFKFNRPESPNVVASWQGPWDEVPDCALKLEAWERLKACLEALSEAAEAKSAGKKKKASGKAFVEAFVKACRKPFEKASPKPLPNQEQEQEQEQDVSFSRARKPIPPNPQPPDPRGHFPAGVLDVWDEYRKVEPHAKPVPSIPESDKVVSAIQREGGKARLIDAMRGNALDPFLTAKGQGHLRRLDRLLTTDAVTSAIARLHEGPARQQAAPGRAQAPPPPTVPLSQSHAPALYRPSEAEERAARERDSKSAAERKALLASVRPKFTPDPEDPPEEETGT